MDVYGRYIELANGLANGVKLNHGMTHQPPRLSLSISSCEETISTSESGMFRRAASSRCLSALGWCKTCHET